MTEVFVCCLNQNCFSFHKYATENCPNKPICINKILQQIVGDEIVTRVYCSNSQSVFLTKTGKLHFYNFIQDQEKTKKNKVSRNIKKKRKLNKKHRSHSQLKQNSDCPNFLSSTPSFLPYLYSFQNDEQEIPNLRKEFYIENRTEKKKKTKKKINQENQNVVSALNLSNTEIKKEIKKKVVTISKFKGKRVEKIVFSKKGAVVLVEGDVYQLFYNTVPDNKAKINRIAFNPKRQIIDLVAGDYWYVAIDRYQKPYFWGECHQMDLCGKKKKKDKIAQDTKREKQKKNKNKSIVVSPTLIKGFERERVQLIDCGDQNLILLSDREELFVCGVNCNGQLATGNYFDQKYLKLIPYQQKLFGGIIKICCSSSYSMLLNNFGKVFVSGLISDLLPNYEKNLQKICTFQQLKFNINISQITNIFTSKFQLQFSNNTDCEENKNKFENEDVCDDFENEDEDEDEDKGIVIKKGKRKKRKERRQLKEKSIEIETERENGEKTKGERGRVRETETEREKEKEKENEKENEREREREREREKEREKEKEKEKEKENEKEIEIEKEKEKEKENEKEKEIEIEKKLYSNNKSVCYFVSNSGQVYTINNGNNSNINLKHKNKDKNKKKHFNMKNKNKLMCILKKINLPREFKVFQLDCSFTHTTFLCRKNKVKRKTNKALNSNEDLFGKNSKWEEIDGEYEEEEEIWENYTTHGLGNFILLPTEQFISILSYLPLKNLSMLSQVSKDIHELASHDWVWSSHFKNRFGDPDSKLEKIIERPKLRNSGWKEAFIKTARDLYGPKYNLKFVNNNQTSKQSKDHNSKNNKIIDRIIGYFKIKPTFQIIVLGLTAVGKSTIIYKLILDDDLKINSTPNCLCEILSYQGYKLICWEVSESLNSHNRWFQYFSEPQALVWVVNTSDRNKIEQSKNGLHRVLENEEMKNIPVLIYANKFKDSNRAMTMKELVKKLELKTLEQNWYLQPCIAIKKKGLTQGMDWIIDNLNHQYQQDQIVDNL
ncbi:adp-ribosylation factor f-related [Anaeramoeba flamelloides]|uniref:Adp-ribosylation factor f-related n=1 Tax=Anaeramoeba flamelloides TaxID=1746091 RepID=A0AAV7YJF5_9EUKA|nr:adp-ribosylation factor f-related [Anaeramoeba flamelloides]